MKYKPHSYQELITDTIIDNPRVGVWAGMGMGKTAATLTAISCLQLADPRPALVLAPKRPARTTWPNERTKWDHLKHLRVSVMIGTAEERRAALSCKADIYTMNYDNLPWLLDELKKQKRSWPFKIVVADEATRLKNFRIKGGGRRAFALARVTHTQVDRFIELTGTPSPNGVLDLWGQMWFLDRGLRLGYTFTAFTQRWFTTIWLEGFHKQVPHVHSLDEVKERVKDIVVAVDPKDYFDIKEPIVRQLKFDLPPKARKHYLDMEKEFFTEIEEEGFEAVNSAAKSQKCLQLASGAIYIDGDTSHWEETHDEKIDVLQSVIEEAAGMPVLVAYHWRHSLARVMKAFPQARYLDDKPKTEADWNAGKIPLLLAHPASAGHGLNLQDGGNILVFFDHWWDMEIHDQIIERIGPMRQLQSGHDRAVFVYYIMARDTLDEEVIERHASKRSVQEILMAAAKRGRRPHGELRHSERQSNT